jgi:Tfp pilus assembly pilus retraction ATPase PilT
LFPELTDLFDDEEKEVAISAVGAFADLIIDVYSKDEKLRDNLTSSLKSILSNQALLTREDTNRLLFEVTPQVAQSLNASEDSELYQLLF